MRDFLHKKNAEEPLENKPLKNNFRHDKKEWNFHSQLNKKSMRFTMSNFKIAHDNSLKARTRQKSSMSSYQRLLAEKTDDEQFPSAPLSSMGVAYPPV